MTRNTRPNKSSEELGAKPAARRGSRRWLAWLVLPVVAVGPWFVPWPWQDSGSQPQANPSSIIEQAHSEQPAPRAGVKAPTAPSAANLTQLSQAVAGTTGSYDLPVPADLASVKTTPGGYTKVGRIAIPSVGLDVSYGEGVYAQALERGPGHWPGTPLPGEAGNSVLSGHRNTHTQPFKLLNRLQHGDKIVVSVGKGDPVTFRVDSTTIVPEAKFKDFVLRQPSDPATRQITLFACHPEGNPIYRIVVRATAR